MALILLPKGTYVFLTEACREAVLVEGGTFKPGKEIHKGTVLQAIEDFPKRRGEHRELVKYRVVRRATSLIGARDIDYKSETIVNKDDEIYLYMREVFEFLKADAAFQEEVSSFEEKKDEAPGIVIAGDMHQAINLFVRGEDNTR